MSHVVLLGDSIFDNARYVPDRPSVLDQLRKSLPGGWSATLLAVDGNVTEDVATQLRDLPTDASHLIVSVGGNDALSESAILREEVGTVREALVAMYEVRARFQRSYHAMLRGVAAVGKPMAVCTIYDTIPGLEPADHVALAAFNEVILREAVSAAIPIIDLRLVCTHPADYSPLSPIEPSVVGGGKIVNSILRLLTQHDFSRAVSAIFS